MWAFLALAVAARTDVHSWTTKDGLPQNTVTDIAQASDGRLWVTTFGGLALFDGRHFEPVEVVDGEGRPLLRFTAVVRDPGGAVWLGTADRGLFRRHAPDGFRAVPGQTGTVFAIRPDGDGIRAYVDGSWVRCGDAGCTPLASEPPPVVELNSAQWSLDREAASLVGVDGVSVPVPDRIRVARELEGALWVGFETAGLMRVRDLGFEEIPMGSSVSVGVAEDGSRLVLGIEGRLRRLSATGESTALSETPVWSLCTRRDGPSWVAGSGGVQPVHPDGLGSPLQLDGTGRSVAAVDDVLWIAGDRDGASWLWKVRNGGVEREIALPVDATNAAIFAVSSDEVVVSSAGRVMRFDGSTFSQPTLDDGTTLAEARDAVRIGTDLWIGTYGQGLIRVRDGEAKSLGVEQGLCDPVVSRVVVVPGALWLNSNHGAYRVSHDRLNEALEGGRPVECRVIGTEEGNGRGGTAAVDASGTVWFPTVSGIAGVTEADDARESPRPIARVLRVESAGNPVVEGGSLSGTPALDIEFGAIDLIAPERLRFRHRLIGADDQWSDVGDQNEVRWSELGPGDYRFEVAASSGGGWGEPAVFRFRVPRPLSDSWWLALGAPILLALASAGAVALLTSRRRRALEEELRVRARFEAELREREQRLAMVFESTTNGLWVHRPDFEVVETNPAGAALIPQNARLPEDWIHPQDLTSYELLLTRAGAGATTRMEVRTLLGATLIASARRITRDGSPQILVTVTDITEERQAEEEQERLRTQLRRVQSLDSIGRLAGGVAHDFNNLLAIILGQVELVGLHHPDAEDRLEPIEAAARRGAGLARKLLVFGQGQPADRRVVEPRERIDRTLDLLRRLVPVEIGFEVRGEGPPIRMDPGQLEQALVNLVANARDAMPDGGVIAIEISETRVGARLARDHAVVPGSYCVIAVRDTGTGIEPDVADRLFEPFFTTRENSGGTGLGLTVVHGCVRGAGGFVTVESHPGAGACFRLVLPAADGLPETTEEVPDTPTLSGSVLLCDDDPEVLAVLTALAQRLGLEATGETAASAVLERLRAGERFDLLVTDVSMPEMNGPQLVGEARRIVPDLKVVYVTGHGPSLAEDGRFDDSDPILGKPFTGADFAAVLARFLG